MNRRDVPAGVLSKIMELTDAAEYLMHTLAKNEEAIAAARARLSGGISRQGEYDDLSASLRQLVSDKPVREKKLHSAQQVLLNCRIWLDRLPEGTVLEPVEVKTDGQSFEDVRARIEAAMGELTALRAVPTPSADIEERIRHYVYAMARPQIAGVGKAEKLKVIWPGAGFDNRGPRENRAEVLPMMALLFPDAMVAALMREVERMANDPLPQAERKKRIAALEHEIEQLAYVEEALIAAAIAEGEDVQRSPSAPPAAILGVKVATKVSRAA